MWRRCEQRNLLLAAFDTGCEVDFHVQHPTNSSSEEVWLLASVPPHLYISNESGPIAGRAAVRNRDLQVYPAGYIRA